MYKWETYECPTSFVPKLQHTFLRRKEKKKISLLILRPYRSAGGCISGSYFREFDETGHVWRKKEWSRFKRNRVWSWVITANKIWSVSTFSIRFVIKEPTSCCAHSLHHIQSKSSWLLDWFMRMISQVKVKQRIDAGTMAPQVNGCKYLRV